MYAFLVRECWRNKRSSIGFTESARSAFEVTYRVRDSVQLSLVNVSGIGHVIVDNISAPTENASRQFGWNANRRGWGWAGRQLD